MTKIKSKHWQKTRKHGIFIPKNWKEVMSIDKENCDTLQIDMMHPLG